MFRAVIKTECDFKIDNREEIKQCRVCQTPLQLEEKWLLELPQIYTIGFQYADIDMQMDRSTLRKLYYMLEPKLNLSRIYKVSEVSESPTNATYVARGLIVYYGLHYWAYFYSQKFDSWFQFDDAKISRIGNF